MECEIGGEASGQAHTKQVRLVNLGFEPCAGFSCSVPKYGGLHRMSWTLEDCQRKVSCNFGLWHDYLRSTVAVFQRIIALLWACEFDFGNSSAFYPINWPLGRDRRPELLMQTSIWKRVFFVLLQALNTIRHESGLKCLRVGDDDGLSIIKQPTYHILEFQHNRKFQMCRPFMSARRHAIFSNSAFEILCCGILDMSPPQANVVMSLP